MSKFLSFRSNYCKFSGIWQENDLKEIVSYGTVASAEIGFDGNAIYIHGHFDKGINVFVDDNNVQAEEYREGYIIRTDKGRHALKIQSVPGSRIYLKGFEPSLENVFFKTPDKKYVQFIGDSITHAYPGFTDRCAKILNADYSCVATCGMSLVDGWGWYQIPDWLTIRPGMESMFFKLENVNETKNYTDYKFEYCRQPDVILIFLGTNDYINNESEKESGNYEKFANHYLSFVKNLRAHYNDSKIVIMGPVSGSVYRKEATEQAVGLIKSKLKNIYFMKTDAWDIDICSDKTHPTDLGYKQISKKAACFLESLL